MRTAATVWWMLLWHPGISVYQLLRILKGSSYNWQKWDTHYWSARRRGRTLFVGSQLSGLMFNMVERGHLYRVNGLGPRGGYGYYAARKLPKEMME